MNHSLQVVEDWRQLDELASEWDRLAEELPSSSWFQSAEATLSLADRTDPDLRPSVIIARDRTGRLEGVLPLGIRHARHGLCPHVLVPLVEWRGSFFDLVARTPRCATAMWAHGRQHASSWDRADIRHVPDDAMIRTIDPDRWQQSGVAKSLHYPTGAMHTSPGELRKKLRRLRRAGEVEFFDRTPSGELPALIERFAALHTERWQDHGPAAEFRDTAGRERLRLALERSTATGRARAGRLRIDGDLVAIHLAVRWRDTQYVWRVANAKGWERYSIGMVLYDLMLQAAAAEGCTSIALGRGDEAYKDRWHPTTAALWRYSRFGPTVRGRMTAMLAGIAERAPFPRRRR